MKIIFKWFDFWIGVFVDTKKELIYILPIPMVGVVIPYSKFSDWVFKKYGTLMILNVFTQHTKDGETCWGYKLRVLGKNFFRKKPAYR